MSQGACWKCPGRALPAGALPPPPPPPSSLSLCARYPTSSSADVEPPSLSAPSPCVHNIQIIPPVGRETEGKDCSSQTGIQTCKTTVRVFRHAPQARPRKPPPGLAAQSWEFDRPAGFVSNVNVNLMHRVVSRSRFLFSF